MPFGAVPMSTIELAMSHVPMSLENFIVPMWPIDPEVAIGPHHKVVCREWQVDLTIITSSSVAVD
jgi:hypothetical protein